MNLATIDCSTTDTEHWTSNNEPATMDFAIIVSRRMDLAKINLATMYSATIYIANFFSETMDTATFESAQWKLPK
jgi:hypothetical protein